MFKDQAAALRQMKLEQDAENESPETFLATVPHSNKLIAVALIVPDEYEKDFPPIQTWLPKVMNNQKKCCFWDQSEIATDLVIKKQAGTLRYRMLETVDINGFPLTIRPCQNDYSQIIHDEPSERINLLKHLVHDLKPYSEIWISIKASKIKEYNSILQACSAACIMIPNNQNAVLKCYEAIKTIRNLGFFSTIGLLEFTSRNALSKPVLSDKIKNVAKNFLGLDLIGFGVVLSYITYEAPKNYSCPSEKIAALPHKDSDFLYILSESILYQIPGMI